MTSLEKLSEIEATYRTKAQTSIEEAAYFANMHFEGLCAEVRRLNKMHLKIWDEARGDRKALDPDVQAELKKAIAATFSGGL